MALETGTYISDLVNTNPPQSDSLTQAAGHLRLIKDTLKTTFPNVTGAVTATHTALNTAASTVAAGQFVPAGVVQRYAGASLPTGYLWCDGTSYLRATYPGLFTAIGTAYGAADGTHFNVPDTRDVFSMGKGSTFSSLGAEGGATTATIAKINLPAYNLSFSLTASGGFTATGSTGTVLLTRTSNNGNQGAGGNPYIPSITDGTSPVSVSGTLSGAAVAGTVPLGGSGTAMSIMNPYIVFNNIIKT